MSLPPTCPPRHVLTASGELLSLDAPDPEHLDLYALSVALSQQGLFVGHTDPFYSVAQHAMLVSDIVEPRYALAGLLHCAPQAFLSSALPLLRAAVPQLAAWEQGLHRALEDTYRLGCGVLSCPSVIAADAVALGLERRAFLPDCASWPRVEWLGLKPAKPLGPMDAFAAYGSRLEALDRHRFLPEVHAW